MVRLASLPEPILVKDEDVSLNSKRQKDDVSKNFSHGDHFERGGIDMLEHTTQQSLDFHKTIQDSHRAEE